MLTRPLLSVGLALLVASAIHAQHVAPADPPKLLVAKKPTQAAAMGHWSRSVARLPKANPG